MRWIGLAVVLLLGVSACSSTPENGATLLLRNQYWDKINVQVVVTPSGDCDNKSAYVETLEFVLNKNASRSIIAPHAENICWRKDRNPNNPSPGEWSSWSHATMYPGQSADTDI